MRVCCSTRREPDRNTAGLLVCNLLVQVKRNKESSAVVRLEGKTGQGRAGQGEPHGRPACGVGTPVRCRGASLSNMDSRSRWLSFALYGLAYPTSQWSLRFSDQIRMVHRSGQRKFFRDACKAATCRCGWMCVVTGSGGVRAEQRIDHFSSFQVFGSLREPDIRIAFGPSLQVGSVPPSCGANAIHHLQVQHNRDGRNSRCICTGIVTARKWESFPRLMGSSRQSLNAVCRKGMRLADTSHL